MIKIIFAILAFFAITLVSCDEIPIRNPGSFNKTGTTKKSRVKSDTTNIPVIVVQNDTIDIMVDSFANYKCKYPTVVQKILLEKRTQIFIKEARDINFYSKAFLDVFEIEKTHSSILMYYDNLVDSAIVKLSLKGEINFANLASNTGLIIK